MKLSTAVTIAAAGVALSAMAYAGILRREVYREHLAGLNAAARADSTHHVLLRDLAVARREAEQVRVDLDKRTHERDEAGVALANLDVQFKAVSGRTYGTASSGTMPGTVHLAGAYDAWEQAGVRVTAAVDVAILTSMQAPGVAKDSQVLWDWTVARRPLELAVDFSCRRDTALVHVIGPTWASVDVARAVQSPTVCNPPPRAWQPFAFTMPSLPVFAVIAGAAAVLGWSLHP